MILFSKNFIISNRGYRGFSPFSRCCRLCVLYKAYARYINRHTITVDLLAKRGITLPLVIPLQIFNDGSIFCSAIIILFLVLQAESRLFFSTMQECNKYRVYRKKIFLDTPCTYCTLPFLACVIRLYQYFCIFSSGTDFLHSSFFHYKFAVLITLLPCLFF